MIFYLPLLLIYLYALLASADLKARAMKLMLVTLRYFLRLRFA